MMRQAMLATVGQSALLQAVEEQDKRPLDWVAAYRTVRAVGEQNSEENKVAS